MYYMALWEKKLTHTHTPNVYPSQPPTMYANGIAYKRNQFSTCHKSLNRQKELEYPEELNFPNTI